MKPDNKILLERIEILCKEKGISKNTAFIESGAGKNFISNMEIANPTDGKIALLAIYFNVSIEYLKGKTDDRKQMIQKERKETEMKKIKTFYEETSDLLEKQKTSYESLLKELGLDAILIKYYKRGFLPSELVINTIAKKTQTHSKDLMDKFKSFYDLQLDSELEVIISNFKSLKLDQKGGVAHYSCILKDHECDNASDVLRLIDLSSNEVGLIKVYRGVSPEGQNEIIHQVHSIRDKEKKISTDSIEDVAN